MISIILLVCLGPWVADGVDDVIKKADVAFQGKKWQSAAALYAKAVQLDPKRGRAWFRLGYSRHASKQFDGAIIAYRRATDFPTLRPVALYNLGCALALTGKTEDAVKALSQAIQAGFSNKRQIANDLDLIDLHTDPDFQKLLKALNVTSPAQRQFDFWVGQWDVFNPQGTKVGTNSITREQSGRVIMERWTSTSGGGGQSMNYVDPETGRWRQLWIDGGGGKTEYEGTLVNGEMRFVGGKRVEPNGTIKLARSTFSPLDGDRVRQFIEHSIDGGKTWKTYFDGTYVRQADQGGAKKK